MPGELNEIVVYLRGGLNTAVDTSSIDKGQLVQANGMEFRPPRLGLFGTLGRIRANNTATAIGGVSSNNRISSLTYMTFDRVASDANQLRDYVIAWVGNGSNCIPLIASAAAGFATMDFHGAAINSFSQSATAYVNAVHHLNTYWFCNGADRNLRLEGKETDNSSYASVYYAGKLDATASGTALRSGTAGYLMATGDYELWWVEANRQFPGDDPIGSDFEIDGAYTGTPTTFTLSASGGIIFTCPSTATTDGDTSGYFWLYSTIAGGKYPFGFFVGSVAPASTVITATADGTLPYPVVGPVGGVPVSSHGAMPPAVDLAVFQDRMCAIPRDERKLLRYSLAREPIYFPSTHYVPFDLEHNDDLTALLSLNDSLIVWSTFATFRVDDLLSSEDPQPLAQVRGKLKTEIGTAHGCVSPRGKAKFMTSAGVELCLFVCRDGIHITDGTRIDYASRTIDWASTVDISQLNRSSMLNNPKRHRIEFRYLDSSSVWQRLDFYYYGDLLYQANGPFPGLAIMGPEPVPGPAATLGVLNGDWKVWNAADASAYVFGEMTGTTDNALLVDSDGTMTHQWKTKVGFPAGINGEVELHRVYTHQSDTTASGSYPLRIHMSTDDLHAGVPFTATSTVTQSLKGAQPHEFTDRAQSIQLSAAKSDTGSLQELDYVVFVVKNPSELASAKSS